MKSYTSLIHHIVYWLRLSPLFCVLGQSYPFFLKFIPPPSYFKKGVFQRVKRNHTFFSLDLSDYMQWHIFASQPDDSWEKAQKNFQSPQTIIDIGANVGAFSLKLANALKNQKETAFEIIAFEPNPPIFENLQNNIALNSSIAHFIKVKKLALAHQNSTMAFHFSPTNSGGGQLSMQSHNQSISVPVSTLDDYLAQNPPAFPISFIKIDVEGFEPFVIEGAQKTISQYKPNLYIEITESWFQKNGRSVQEIYAFLDTLGYRYTVPIPLPRQFNLWATIPPKLYP